MRNTLVLVGCLPTLLLAAEKPVRTQSEVDARGRAVIKNYSDQKLAGYGILDATKAPYNADPTGAKDSTEAIETAMRDARDARLITYLPPGRYRVSNTITCIQGTVKRDGWPYDKSDPYTENASYDYPCTLRGSATRNRSTLVLADGAAGYGDADHPKPVVHLWSRSETPSWTTGKIDPTRPQPNISFNQVIIDVDFELGEGNLGAAAIDHQAAQGSVVEGARINAKGAFAGVLKAPGSGGAIHGLRVTGGQYGVYIRSPQNGSQPVPVISNVELTGQSVASILYDGRGPLTVVGAKINGAGIVSDRNPGVPWDGPLNIVDSILEVQSGNPAVTSNHAVYLSNVYVRGSKTLARVHEQSDYELPSETEWSHVREFASTAGGSYPDWVGAPSKQYPIRANGRKGDDAIADVASGTPPPDLITRHTWSRPPPAWDTGDVANVKEAPYTAAGDGKTDDAAAIQKAIDSHTAVFLPKGVYAISRPLTLRADTQLFGLGTVQTTIQALDGADAWSHGTQPAPLVTTVNDKDARTTLAFLELQVPVKNPAVYALHWRAGRHSIVRNVNPRPTMWHPDAPAAPGPAILISGNGGGKWYNLNQVHWWAMGPDHRHLVVRDTAEPLSFYMMNPEHGRGAAQVEFSRAWNVTLYATKGEGDSTLFELRGCRNIRFFGYGGNGSPAPGSPMFKIAASDDLLFANIAPQLIQERPNRWTALGIHYDGNKWYLIEDHLNPAEPPTRLLGVEPVVVYKRGHPTSAW